MATVKVINVSNNKLPKYETSGSAGMDIRVDLSRVTPDNPIKGFGDAEVIWSGEGHTVPMVRIAPMSRALLPTGLFTAIPEGYQVSLRPRSGMAIKKGLLLCNTPGTLDEDYRGEWMLPVINLGQEDIYIENGERICQALLEKVNKIEWKVVESLDETERGEGGFGHSGSK
jgi:dUTP pyrophosphatase